MYCLTPSVTTMRGGSGELLRRDHRLLRGRGRADALQRRGRPLRGGRVRAVHGAHRHARAGASGSTAATSTAPRLVRSRLAHINASINIQKTNWTAHGSDSSRGLRSIKRFPIPSSIALPHVLQNTEHKIRNHTTVSSKNHAISREKYRFIETS